MHSLYINHPMHFACSWSISRVNTIAILLARVDLNIKQYELFIIEQSYLGLRLKLI